MPIIKISYRWCMWLPAAQTKGHKETKPEPTAPCCYPTLVTRGDAEALRTHPAKWAAKQCVLKSPGSVPSSAWDVLLWKAHKVSHSCINLCLEESCITHHCILCWANQNFWNKKGQISSVLRTLPAFCCKYYPKTGFWTYYPGIIRQLRAYIYSWNQQSFHFYCSSLWIKTLLVWEVTAEWDV